MGEVSSSLTPRAHPSSRPELSGQPEDSLSRDSGNSSGGTPEQARRGLLGGVAR